MFSDFSTPAPSQALTLEGIRRVTGLAWIQVDLDDPQIPADQGIYAWVDTTPPHALRYHGSGSGKGGLRARLVPQLRWRANQQRRVSIDPSSRSQQDAFDIAREVPAIQQAAGDRRLYYSITGPAPWTVQRSEIKPPGEALEWESFLSATTLLVTGHRGLVGGGAWESKAGSIGDLMTDLAWDRLLDVNEGTWD